VADAVTRFTRDIDADASFQNRSKYDELRERARQSLARYLGADADEIAIVRNTSEGNNTVVNGLDLGRGDDVVVWDQNHPTAGLAWEVRAQRCGFAVRRVTTPPEPATAQDLIAPFQRALTPGTRVLAFSHVSNLTGVALPALELCRMARERGILTLVDGAQALGALGVNVHQLGCDVYTASAHKWLLGPKEAGVLYVRREVVPRLWASDVGVGWEAALQHGARKFETLGQRDEAAVAAVETMVAFHETVGPERIEARVRALAEALRGALTRTLPGLRFHTPAPAALSAGVLVFLPPRDNTRELYEALYREHGIAGAAMSGAFPGLRLSPHIYNTIDEIERVAEGVAALV
jgi:selenocysteine lyase/cysteine desulfurase